MTTAPDLPGEEWRPVVGYEGRYEVSDRGRVRSRARRPEGRILKQLLDQRGYYYVRLGRGSGMSQQHWLVHRLVAFAWHGAPPADAPFACHNNGDSTDNRPSNLRWGSPSDNMWDTVRHGRHYNKNKTHCAEGHEFTPENTKVVTYPSRPTWTHRRCRTCEAARSRRRAEQRKLDTAARRAA